MDTQAYLLRHGWAGPGNPLNANRCPGARSGLGLTRPLLAARKQDTHGLGRKKTGDPANQWWLRGFDDALKGMGNVDNTAGSRLEGTALGSELYRFFVRGEGLKGTIGQNEDLQAKERKKEKRKRNGDGDGDVRTHKREEKKRKKRERREIDDPMSTESKEERRARKQARREKRERKEEKKKRKRRKMERKDEKRNDDDISIHKERVQTEQWGKANPEDEYPTPTTTEPEQGDSSCDSKDKMVERRESRKRKNARQ